MSISPTLRKGALVTVRQRRWRIAEVSEFDDCRVVALVGVGAGNAGAAHWVIAPFDDVETIDRPDRIRFVSRRRWRNACGTAIAATGSPTALRTVADAKIDVMPHQLEPALALVAGRGSRVLVADEVGLGKTIQAGIVASELSARGAADRILVLAPAGLREQWAQELAARFRIDATVVDFRTIRQRLAELPSGLNPWSTFPVAIASIDFVKRIEVLRAVLSCSWDMVIVDEAHGVASDSDRHAAVEALASKASYLVLLTATPHNGDKRLFDSLCRLGSHGDELLLFRRTRETTGGSRTRRVHRVFVRPTGAEVRMHSLLGTFTAAVLNERGRTSTDVWLALAVLLKRALSSAHSLARSVERRLDALAVTAADAQQLRLPLDGRGETDAADDAPSWCEALTLKDVHRERRLLAALASAANDAASGESKIAALVRLLRRIAEPAIVFTEYRDTLQHVARAIGRSAATIHGGMSRGERSASIEAFASGATNLLLATDAAAEGLNLHRTCRTVINLELSWSPVRLEQRIGRVDRIGQSRTVHAFHLIARGTDEIRVLDRLRLRVARARSDIGSADPVGGTATAEVVDRTLRPEADLDPAIPLQSFHVEATVEAERIALARRLRSSCQIRCPESHEVWTVRTRRRTTRKVLGTRVLLIWRVVIEDVTGREAAGDLTGVTIPVDSASVRPRDRKWLEEFVAALSGDVAATVELASTDWCAHALEAARRFVEANQLRQRAIAASSVDGPADVQPGLFDRRAEAAHAAVIAARQDIAAHIAARIARLERAADLSVRRPKVLFVLLPLR